MSVGVSRYRPEIDGLRTIAVVPVVLYHAGLRVFSGGFVGVDVFFVISGYLITGILYREAVEGRFSIARFYERRVRRIFPALFAVLAATIVAGLFILMPRELGLLGRSSIATTVFASNILFFLESGYFDQSAILKPLLHTWSLAVEEQFYIVMPLAIWALCRWRIGWLLPAILIGAAISFGLSMLLLGPAPSFTFYMLPTRAWELLIGSALALLPAFRARWAGPVAWAGLAMIAAAVLFFTHATPFPGLAAALPCLGAAAVIWAGEGTSAGRLLATAPMRGIGLISYSLYLWHWPVLVYARFLYGETLPLPVAAACIGIAFAAAWLSWRYVERPFRAHGRSRGPIKPLLVGAGVMAVSLGIGALVWTGLPARLPPEAARMAAAATIPQIGDVPGCFIATAGAAGMSPAECIGPPSRQPKLVLWGDSHALQFVDPIEGIAGEAGMTLRLVGRGGCLPVPGQTPVRGGVEDAACRAFNDATVDAILADDSVRTVVLAGRWSRLAFAANNGEAQRFVGAPARADTVMRLLASLDASVARLQASGRRVVIIGDVPEFRKQLPQCLARAIWKGLDQAICEHAHETLPGTPMDRLLTGFAARHPGVTLVKPTGVVCPDGQCARIFEGLPISRDADHLTDAAAAHVANRMGLREAITAR